MICFAATGLGTNDELRFILECSRYKPEVVVQSWCTCKKRAHIKILFCFGSFVVVTLCYLFVYRSGEDRCYLGSDK